MTDATTIPPAVKAFTMRVTHDQYDRWKEAWIASGAYKTTSFSAWLRAVIDAGTMGNTT